jgi:hypothetical protein
MYRLDALPVSTFKQRIGQQFVPDQKYVLELGDTSKSCVHVVQVKEIGFDSGLRLQTQLSM